ncbi:MAG: hypothetical protein ACK5HY_03015 [Parahaliea sp.]
MFTFCLRITHIEPGGVMSTSVGLITEKQIRRGIFTAFETLETAIQDVIDTHNADYKPFIWTTSVSEIPEKMGRAREAIQFH